MPAMTCSQRVIRLSHSVSTDSTTPNLLLRAQVSLEDDRRASCVARGVAGDVGSREEAGDRVCLQHIGVLMFSPAPLLGRGPVAMPGATAWFRQERMQTEVRTT